MPPDELTAEGEQPERLAARMQQRAAELQAREAALTPEQREADRKALVRVRRRCRQLWLEQAREYGGYREEQRTAQMLAGRIAPRRPRERGAGRPRARRSSRASSRSGDDPGSSEGDGEPSARPFLLLATTRGTVER